MTYPPVVIEKLDFEVSMVYGENDSACTHPEVIQMRIRLTPGTALLLLVLLSTVVTAGATEKQERVFAKVNRTFQVKLPENPSTGFRWEASFDRELLVLQARTYIPDPRGVGRVGAGGTAVFSFLPLKKGTTTIIMRYHRTWEKETAQKVSIRVSIDE